MGAWIPSLLAALASPGVGLPAVYDVTWVSATLLPMGSEAAVLGLVKLNPDPFWPCVAYMAIGKLLRCVAMTAVALWLWPGVIDLG